MTHRPPHKSGKRQGKEGGDETLRTMHIGRTKQKGHGQIDSARKSLVTHTAEWFRVLVQITYTEKPALRLVLLCHLM